MRGRRSATFIATCCLPSAPLSSSSSVDRVGGCVLASGPYRCLAAVRVAAAVSLLANKIRSETGCEGSLGGMLGGSCSSSRRIEEAVTGRTSRGTP